MNILNMNLTLTLLGCAGLTVLTGLPSVPGKVINMCNATPRLPVQSCFRFKMTRCVHCLYYPFTDGIRQKVTVLRACWCVYWKSETKRSPLLIWNNWLLPIELERRGRGFHTTLQIKPVSQSSLIWICCCEICKQQRYTCTWTWDLPGIALSKQRETQRFERNVGGRWPGQKKTAWHT